MVGCKTCWAKKQANFQQNNSTNSCQIWMIPVSNKRAKRFDVAANRAMIYPKQLETLPQSVPNHSLKEEELKESIMTNKKVDGMMERC